jgi:hypothetical protein
MAKSPWDANGFTTGMGGKAINTALVGKDRWLKTKLA